MVYPINEYSAKLGWNDQCSIGAINKPNLKHNKLALERSTTEATDPNTI